MRGRVLNTATGEYVRNAEIRVEGTTIVTYSEDGGNFRLTGVPAGEVTVVVKYTGLQESRAVANVVAGQVVTLDFELKVPSYTARVAAMRSKWTWSRSPPSAKARPAPSWSAAPR